MASSSIIIVQCEDSGWGEYFVRDVAEDGSNETVRSFTDRDKAEAFAAKLAGRHGVRWETNY